MVKEQVACASTELGDSLAPSRTGESSELGEVFGQANLLCEKQLEFPGREAEINVPYPIPILVGDEGMTRKSV